MWPFWPSGARADGPVAELELPFELRSVGEARRWVASMLAGWSEDGVRAATLVASEMVANVMLHARTAAHLVADVHGDRLRVEVSDGDSRLPAVKHYADDAPTGRGLRLVGGLAEAWGVERRPGGKAVWAVVADRPWPAGVSFGPSAGDPPLQPEPPAEGGGTAPVEVRLLAAPLEVLAEAQSHHDELLREFAFLPGSRHLSARLDALAHRVEAHFSSTESYLRSEIARAATAGEAVVDLRVVLSRAAWMDMQELVGLLDEADVYCERMELLTLASSIPVRGLRRWMIEEFHRQSGGAEPRPWPDPGAGGAGTAPPSGAGQAPAASGES